MPFFTGRLRVDPHRVIPHQPHSAVVHIASRRWYAPQLFLNKIEFIVAFEGKIAGARNTVAAAKVLPALQSRVQFFQTGI